MSEKFGNVRQVGVEGISFGALLDKYGIRKVDLLKVDIEGGELDLFLAVSPRSYSLLPTNYC